MINPRNRDIMYKRKKSYNEEVSATQFNIEILPSPPEKKLAFTPPRIRFPYVSISHRARAVKVI